MCNMASVFFRDSTVCIGFPRSSLEVMMAFPAASLVDSACTERGNKPSAYSRHASCYTVISDSEDSFRSKHSGSLQTTAARVARTQERERRSIGWPLFSDCTFCACQRLMPGRRSDICKYLSGRFRRTNYLESRCEFRPSKHHRLQCRCDLTHVDAFVSPPP